MMVDMGLGINPESYSQKGSRTQWPVYDSSEPDIPDNVITVYDTTGTEDGRAMVTGELFNHFGIQVRIRSKDHVTGWTKANTLRANLSEAAYQETVTIDGVEYLIHAMSRFSNVLVLGKEVDEEAKSGSRVSKRSLFTFNCLVSLKQET